MGVILMSIHYKKVWGRSGRVEVRDYLFGGIPIEIARRHMITIIGIIASEAKAPTKNVILNAVASGIANISPACRGSCISTVNMKKYLIK